MKLPRILTLLFILVVALVPSIAALWLGGTWSSIAIAVLPSWAIIMLRIAYDHSDPLYFWVNRVIMWILNLEVHWDLEAEWTQYDLTRPILSEIVDEIHRLVPHAILRQDDPSHKILECPDSGYSIFVVEQADVSANLLEDTDRGRIVRLRISEMIVPFRFADRTMDRELLPMLSGIQKRVGGRQEKYSVKVSFFGDNPYFGFYLRRLSLPQIHHFSCEFVDKRAGSNVVSVSADSVTIVARDLTNVGPLAKKYLALSPPG